MLQALADGAHDQRLLTRRCGAIGLPESALVLGSPPLLGSLLLGGSLCRHIVPEPIDRARNPADLVLPLQSRELHSHVAACQHLGAARQLV